MVDARSSPRRPVMGSGCKTVVSVSEIPATDSRSSATRGLGHRPTLSTSARATSADARIALTRGLSVDSRASASRSDSTVWAVAGIHMYANAIAANHGTRVRIRLLWIEKYRNGGQNDRLQAGR